MTGQAARWEALPGPERGAIRAGFDRDNPMPPGMHPRLWELTRRLVCLELMETGGPIILAPPPPPPEPAPVPDPPGDPPPRFSEEQRDDFLRGLTPDQRSRVEGCTAARLDEIIQAARLGVLGGERIGGKPAPIPEPELAGGYS